MSEEKQYISHKTVTATLNGDKYQVKCGDCAWIEPKDVFEQSYAEIGDNSEEIKVGDWIQAIGDNKSYKVHDFCDRVYEEDGEDKVVKSLKNIGSARRVMKAKKRLKKSNKNLNKAMQFIEPGYIDDKNINKVFLGHIKNQNEYIIELLEKLTNEEK